MKLFSAILVLLLIFPACSKQHTGEVIKKPSGLQYMDDSLGTGREAKMGDLISVHFDGWMIRDSTSLYSDWTKDSTRETSSIGSSRAFNRPVVFTLGKGEFIKGIDEGIQNMKVGGYRTIVIPANLAYGDKGFGPIQPNSSLKVVVQLLEVKDPIVVSEWLVDSTKYKKTNDGLKYAIITPGEGVAIDSGDVVTMHYSGYLLDGTIFDSSVEKNEPLKFQYKIQPLIKGFIEGISFLKKGGKAKLIIPPDLAYGNRGNSVIPPNSTLIFDIEILNVAKPLKTNQQQAK